jgi:hypothetical protein
MDDRLIEAQAAAVGAVCGKLSTEQLQAIQRSVERACLLPKDTGWTTRAAAHAEIFSLLAGAADDPDQSATLSSGAKLARELTLTAGKSANGITVNSPKRLLACLSADDPEEAARETENYLRVLRVIGRLTARP